MLSIVMNKVHVQTLQIVLPFTLGGFPRSHEFYMAEHRVVGFTLICSNTGTPKAINFLLVTNGKITVLGVPILSPAGGKVSFELSDTSLQNPP